MGKMIMKKLLFSVLIWLAISNAAMAEVAGTVIGVKPDSFAVRARQELQLNLQDNVEKSDSLRTGGNGRLEVLFMDESSIKLGPNTLIDITEFLPDSSAPALRTHVSEGIARFITGTITEQNPDGFVVTTPEATIGVRGTVFNVRTGQGFTTVETLSGLTTVNGFPLPAGNKAVIGPGGSFSTTPLTPAEVQASSSELNNTNEQTGPSPSLPSMPTNNAPTDLAMEDVSSDLLASQNTAPPAATQGVISGNMIPYGPNSSGSGQFGFSFNLTSGAVSNGWMSGNISSLSGGGTLTASGGTGSFDNMLSVFEVGNFSGTWAGQTLTTPTKLSALMLTASGGLPKIGDIVETSDSIFELHTSSNYADGNLDGSRTQ
jgi:Uncharacterized protein conserved in bacteria